MPKPDKVLRYRPLKEVGDALSKLKKVVLFHPEPIALELPPQYCVCKKGECTSGKRSNAMIQCDECYDWFHFKCVGLKDEGVADGEDWKCEWCLSDVDKQGYQRWRTGRKIAKKRHRLDTPRFNGAQPGQDAPTRYSAPVSWDDKVAEVKELARRAAIKKRKLTEAVEQLVDGEGHHVRDAEGLAGLEMRPINEGFIDELVGAGIVNEADYEEDD
jgi:hypothetical protein